MADPNFYGAALVSAGYSQITKDPPEWQQGASGLARRTASWLAVYGIRETMHQGGEAILGYHPRYLSCDCSGFFPRTAHAIKWTFLTRNKSGETRLDLPVIRWHLWRQYALDLLVSGPLSAAFRRRTQRQSADGALHRSQLPPGI